MISKYKSLILLLAPILFLPIEWYDKLVRGDMELVGINGFGVFTFDFFNMLIIYVLCIFIQILSINSRKYGYSISSTILLIFTFTFFPTRVHTLLDLSYGASAYYSLGFFLVTGILT